MVLILPFLVPSSNVDQRGVTDFGRRPFHVGRPGCPLFVVWSAAILSPVPERINDLISPDTPTSTDITETGIAASYYFKKHNYKLQADYRQIEFNEDPTLDNVEARVQLQFIF
jgi:hypothetical protein